MSHTAQGGQKSSHGLSAASSRSPGADNQKHVSLKALDEFFLHCSLITKSFACLYLSSAVSDLRRWALFLGSSTLLLLSAPRQ